MVQIDFGPFWRREKTLAEYAAQTDLKGLIEADGELVARQLALLEGVSKAEVAFVPAVREVGEERAWSLQEQVVHLVGMAEEGVYQALGLARGLEVAVALVGYADADGMDGASDAGALRKRIEDSWRVRRALFEAWPSRPHMDNTFKGWVERRGEVNALARLGLVVMHDQAHVEQIEATLAQARA